MHACLLTYTYGPLCILTYLLTYLLMGCDANTGQNCSLISSPLCILTYSLTYTYGPSCILTYLWECRPWQQTMAATPYLASSVLDRMKLAAFRASNVKSQIRRHIWRRACWIKWSWPLFCLSTYRTLACHIALINFPKHKIAILFSSLFYSFSLFSHGYHLRP